MLGLADVSVGTVALLALLSVAGPGTIIWFLRRPQPPGSATDPRLVTHWRWQRGQGVAMGVLLCGLAVVTWVELLSG